MRDSTVRLLGIGALLAFCLWLFYDRFDTRDVTTIFTVLMGGIAAELGINKMLHRKDDTAKPQEPPEPPPDVGSGA